jgi:hypothetical protein
MKIRAGGSATRTASLAAAVVVGTVFGGSVPAQAFDGWPEDPDPTEIIEPDPVIRRTVRPWGRLLDQGRTAEITIDTLCIAPETVKEMKFLVMVMENNAGIYVSGSAWTTLVCDGLPRRRTIRVDAERFGRPFLNGPHEVITVYRECDLHTVDDGSTVTVCGLMDQRTDVLLRK